MAGWGPGGPASAYQDPGLRWAHHLDSGGQNIYAVGHLLAQNICDNPDIFGPFHVWFFWGYLSSVGALGTFFPSLT